MCISPLLFSSTTQGNRWITLLLFSVICIVCSKQNKNLFLCFHSFFLFLVDEFGRILYIMDRTNKKDTISLHGYRRGSFWWLLMFIHITTKGRKTQVSHCSVDINKGVLFISMRQIGLILIISILKHHHQRRETYLITNTIAHFFLQFCRWITEMERNRRQRVGLNHITSSIEGQIAFIGFACKSQIDGILNQCIDTLWHA